MQMASLLVLMCCLAAAHAQSSVFGCSFNDHTGPLCGFTQGSGDGMDWTRRSGGTITAATGPAGGYPFNGGSYLYQEVTGKRTGASADLLSPDVTGTGEFCLTFFYHMYGKHVGTLSVIEESASGNGSVLWTASRVNERGINEWRRAEVDVPAAANRLIIRAEKTAGVRESLGDIAIDEIEAFTGPCEDLPPFVAPTTTPAPTTTTTVATTTTPENNGPSVYTCNFDNNDLCGMTRSRDGSSGWQTGSGTTSTLFTGPDGAFSSDSYLYFEASGLEANEMDRLVSPDLGEHQGVCLTFQYHMYGRHIGGLNVTQINDQGVSTLIWTKTKEGQRGSKEWQTATLTLESNVRRVAFSASRGGQERLDIFGDIAVDEVRVTAENCRNSEATTITTTPGTSPATTTGPGTTTSGRPGTTTSGPGTTTGGTPPSTTSAGTPPSTTTGSPSTTSSSTSASTTTARPTTTATTSPTSTTTRSATSNVRFECVFGLDNLCGMIQRTDDDMQWTLNTGGTTSSNTGPFGDEDGSGYYIYLEATNFFPNLTATIETPPFTASVANSQFCLTFAYHMRGLHIGTMYVEEVSQSGFVNEIWRKSRDQGNAWLTASETLASSTNRVRFTAVRGGEAIGQPYGDKAIDNIKIVNGAC